MKKIIIILFFFGIFAGCTSQRDAAYFTSNQRKERGSFIERVKEKFKRKPMSQRRKYKKPMKTTCYVFIEPIEYVGGFNPVRITRLNQGSDCTKYTYNIK